MTMNKLNLMFQQFCQLCFQALFCCSRFFGLFILLAVFLCSFLIRLAMVFVFARLGILTSMILVSRLC